MNDELADGKWLLSIGAEQSMANYEIYVLGDWKPHRLGKVADHPLTFRREGVDGSFFTYVFGYPINARPTRDDVLLLCKALMVSTK